MASKKAGDSLNAKPSLQSNSSSLETSPISGKAKHAENTRLSNRVKGLKQVLDYGMRSVEGRELDTWIRPAKHKMSRAKTNNSQKSEMSLSTKKDSACTLKPKEEYMYNKIEKQHKAEQAKAIIEKQKLELVLRKNHYRPMKKEDLANHSKNYLQHIKAQEESRKLARLCRKKEEFINQLEQKRYETDVSLSVKHKDLITKDNLRKKGEERRRVREKLLLYSSLVQSVFPAVASEEKSAELSRRVARLRHPVRQQRDVKSDYEVSKVVSRFSRASSKLRRHNAVEEKKELVSKTVELDNGKKSDTTKAKRKLPLYDWKKEIMGTSMSRREKIRAIIEQGKIIEEQASMKEERMLAGGLEGDLSLGEYGSDILIGSIKAKIAILEQCT